MFDNAGEKLSKILKVITIIQMITVVFSGIALGIKLESFGVFILMGGLGPLVIWVGSLFLIGFLDMMSDVNMVKNVIYSVYANKRKENDEIMRAMRDNNTWLCSKCKTINKKETVYCENCGNKKNQW